MSWGGSSPHKNKTGPARSLAPGLFHYKNIYIFAPIAFYLDAALSLTRKSNRFGRDFSDFIFLLKYDGSPVVLLLAFTGRRLGLPSGAVVFKTIVVMQTNEERSNTNPNENQNNDAKQQHADIVAKLWELQSELYMLHRAIEQRSEQKVSSKFAAHATDVTKRLYKSAGKIANQVVELLMKMPAA